MFQTCCRAWICGYRTVIEGYGCKNGMRGVNCQFMYCIVCDRDLRFVVWYSTRLHQESWPHQTESGRHQQAWGDASSEGMHRRCLQARQPSCQEVPIDQRVRPLIIHTMTKVTVVVWVMHPSICWCFDTYPSIDLRSRAVSAVGVQMISVDNTIHGTKVLIH